MIQSDTVKIMARLLSQVEEAGQKKYGKIDWQRFDNDGRDDNLASIVRHLSGQTRLGKHDDESGLHHACHAAFRLLMQAMTDLDLRDFKND